MAITVSQDPQAHVFWEVDWRKWLTARGYAVEDIISATWIVPAPIEKTQEVLDGTVARVYVRNVPLSKKHPITCRLTVTNKDGGVIAVSDDYTFFLVGASQ